MKAEFVKSAMHPRDFPESELPEIAFVGRSNVGKSSMINTLLGRKKLVKVGKTPGKTRLVNFFNIDDRVMMVDLPGYGFASVSKSERRQWGESIEKYLTQRPQLKGVVMILDIRRMPSEEDMVMLDWISMFGIKMIIALTKCDKLSNNKIFKQVREISTVLNIPKENFTVFSSVTKKGVDDTWKIIDETVETT
jgi:GTP-binding protein